MPTSLYSEIEDRHASLKKIANAKRHHNNNYCHFEEKKLFLYAFAISLRKDKVLGFIERRQEIPHLHYSLRKARVHSIYNKYGQRQYNKDFRVFYSSVEGISKMLLDKRA